jgi:succinoglycan biosynthesis transport protein ExoP
MIPPHGEESGFDFNEILRVVYRRYKTILAVALTVLVIGVGVTLLQVPLYTATSLVLISPSKERVVAASQDVLQTTAPDSASIDSELEVIRSRNLLGQLADELAKTPTPPPPRAGLQGVFAALQQPLPFMRPAAAPGDRSDPARAVLLRREDTINQLSSAITAKRRRLSYVIEVSATDPSPARAALIVNKLAELYMNAQYEARFDAAKRANTWLSQRLAGLKDELAAKDAAVEQYKLQTGIITATADDKTTFNDQEASALQTNLVAARADAAEKAVRLHQVQSVIAQGGSPDTIAGVASAGRLNDLRKQESEITQRQADLETRYGDLHPAVKKVRTELNDVRAQIAAETRRIVASLANESAVSQARLGAMASSSAAAKGAVASNNRSMVHLSELQRDATTTRDSYDSYLKRFQEIADSGSYKTNDVRLVANATVPKVPTSPKVRQSAITFAILGLLAGFGAAFGLERYQDVLSSAEDFERRLGVTAVTTMPELSRSELRKAAPQDPTPAAYVLAKPMSAFVESLRVLRTAIMYADVDRKTNVVAITSAMPTEGKTTTSFCLARVASLAGQSVVVVDCDLRRRSLQAFLPEKPTVGMIQVLAGEAQWRDVIRRDEASGAWILPSAATNFTPQDVFSSVAMGRLLEELKASFDLVILDCAPVLAIAETRIIARRADTTIIVAKWARAPRKAVQAAIRQLNEAGAHVMGVALNGMDPRAGDYGYGYGYRGYGYGKAYAKYYVN